MSELNDREFVEWCKGPNVKSDADYIRLHTLANTVHLSVSPSHSIVCRLASLRLDLAERDRKIEELCERVKKLEAAVEEAPCGEDCLARSWRESGHGPEPTCNCWKSTVLTTRSAPADPQA